MTNFSMDPTTPVTSPQRAQAAARDAERNQRNLGSPPARRYPNPPAPPFVSDVHPMVRYIFCNAYFNNFSQIIFLAI